MNLAMFLFAVEHVSRICRVLSQPGGNMLLVGLGGSGRQSLARLAAFICGMEVFQVMIHLHCHWAKCHQHVQHFPRIATAWNLSAEIMLPYLIFSASERLHAGLA